MEEANIPPQYSYDFMMIKIHSVDFDFTSVSPDSLHFINSNPTTYSSSIFLPYRRQYITTLCIKNMYNRKLSSPEHHPKHTIL